jgi:hypothetical protein
MQTGSIEQAQRIWVVANHDRHSIIVEYLRGSGTESAGWVRYGKDVQWGHTRWGTCSWCTRSRDKSTECTANNRGTNRSTKANHTRNCSTHLANRTITNNNTFDGLHVLRVKTS